MRVAGAGHSHGVAEVLQAVVGFVGDGCFTGLLFHAWLHAAALHHEARDDSMKHRVVIVALSHITQKILHRFRGFLRVEFQRDDAVVVDVEFD